MTYRSRDAVGPPTAPISHSQRLMLAKITPEWRSIWDIGAANCTNMTLSNLERRGLVELRPDPATPNFFKWQVRLACTMDGGDGR